MVQPEHDQRRHKPGRRKEDQQRDEEARFAKAVALQVQAELHGLRVRWFLVWLITLALSGFALYLSTSAGTTATDAASTATRVADEAAASAKTAAVQSKETCERTRIFGPALANAYEKYRILSPEALRAYRASLPDRC